VSGKAKLTGLWLSKERELVGQMEICAVWDNDRYHRVIIGRLYEKEDVVKALFLLIELISRDPFLDPEELKQHQTTKQHSNNIEGELETPKDP